MTDSNGYLLLDKPCGWTSFDCVSYIKKRYRLKKAGHAGSLDPLATGLIIIMFYEATKWFDLLQKDFKVYEASLLLGTKFDTQDITGKLLEISVPSRIPNEEEVLDVLKSFVGELIQIPPEFSAIKVKGKPAYKYARQGVQLNLSPRKAFIEKIELTKYNFPHISFRIQCKKGFYVRTLCEDIASKMNTIGTLCSLRRVAASGHTIDEAFSIRTLPENPFPFLKKKAAFL